jgi:uncharacterized protein
MTEVFAHGPHALTGEQIDQSLERFADGFAQQLRSPVLHWPDEAGLTYENVSFPALDGVPLEGWFIPCEGSRKLLIINHPMGSSRSGLPTHLEPWRSLWASSGNDSAGPRFRSQGAVFAESGRCWVRANAG